MDNLLYRSVRPVPPKDRKSHPVYNTGRTDQSGVDRVGIRQVSPRTYFQSRQDDVIVSFSFGAWSVQTCLFVLRNMKILKDDFII